MTDAEKKFEEKYEDPTGRAVAVFDLREQADAARQALIEAGFDQADVYLLHGDRDAARLDDSPKWFADTDDELERYKRELRSGLALISVGVDHNDKLKAIRDIFANHGGNRMTHFGEWITKSKNLDPDA